MQIIHTRELIRSLAAIRDHLSAHILSEIENSATRSSSSAG
jgi:hypothetical protein